MVEVRRLVVLSLSLLAGIIASAQGPDAHPAYRNPKLSIEKRVADLVQRMTLEEKVDQIAGGHPYSIVDNTGTFPADRAGELFKELFSVESRFKPRQVAVLHNAAQRFLAEKTRLGIPAMFQGEALHGFMSNGSTSFPQVLGLASTWDPELVRQVFTAAADEMASAGVSQAFTPVIDLARDPRWGRTEETYGEDPYLVARMGVAAIEGLQGTAYAIDRHHVIATAKHFVHGQMEGGRNTGPSNISERELRESFLVPFQAAVLEAKTGSVMASYNEIDGIPVHINHWLLEKVLRQEWSFTGLVTSDGGALQMLYQTHHVSEDAADAARQALAAGVDYDLSDGSVYRTIAEQVRQGKIPQRQLDQAVSRILTAKFRLGLFEDPYVDPDYAERITNSEEHQKLAEIAAEKSIVLLKNEKNLLPLDAGKIRSIAVIGPNAADVHLGGYSREPAHGVSILDGIRSRVGSNVEVLYAEGCKISNGKQGWAGWYQNDVTLPNSNAERGSIQAAAELARRADVAVVVVGENETTNREAWSENHLGDRDSLDLLGSQNELIRAIVETGKPTIVFLLNGRPLSINYAAAHVPAILEGWYLGQEGGTAAARVLFGDVNPGGKLPVTFPRSAGQLPAYYNHKPSRNRSYAFVDNSPLFPFGFGLSYTSFHFDPPRVEPAVIAPRGSARLRIVVSNTGQRAGDEAVQLYIHQRVASVTQPVMRLAAFRRVSLQPGEKTNVEFAITQETLSILDANMRRTVEPGIFDILVGPSSAETQSVELMVTQ